jgi:hypothetical protein
LAFSLLEGAFCGATMSGLPHGHTAVAAGFERCILHFNVRTDAWWLLPLAFSVPWMAAIVWVCLRSAPSAEGEAPPSAQEALRRLAP